MLGHQHGQPGECDAQEHTKCARDNEPRGHCGERTARATLAAMSGDHQTNEPTPSNPDAPELRPTDPEVRPFEQSNAQHQPMQEVQHVRVGAGVGSGVRVQQFPAVVNRRHLGRAGDVQDTLQVPREALQRMRAQLEQGDTDAVRSMLDSWIGAVEAAQSVPPPSDEAHHGEVEK